MIIFFCKRYDFTIIFDSMLLFGLNLHLVHFGGRPRRWYPTPPEMRSSKWNDASLYSNKLSFTYWKKYFNIIFQSRFMTKIVHRPFNNLPLFRVLCLCILEVRGMAKSAKSAKMYLLNLTWKPKICVLRAFGRLDLVSGHDFRMIQKTDAVIWKILIFSAHFRYFKYQVLQNLLKYDPKDHVLPKYQKYSSLLCYFLYFCKI